MGEIALNLHVVRNTVARYIACVIAYEIPASMHIHIAELNCVLYFFYDLF